MYSYQRSPSSNLDYFLQDQGGRNVWHLAALAGHERPDPVKWPERKEENGFWVTIQ